MKDDIRALVTKLVENNVPEQDIIAFIQKYDNEAMQKPETFTEGVVVPTAKDIGTMVSNVPKSAYEYGKNIADTATGLSQTVLGLPESSGVEDKRPIVNGITDLAKDVAGNVVAPGLMEAQEDPERGKQLVAFTDAIMQRYGSMDKFKETVMQDPVGTMADLSTVMMGGGAALKAAGAAKIGRAMGQAGALLEPVNAAVAVAKSPKALIPKSLPSKMYQSGAKFSTVLPKATREKLTRTALDNGIAPTLSGVDKVRAMINELNGKITGLVDNATSSGSTIPIDRLFAEFDQIKKQMLEVSGDPLRYEKAFDNVRKNIEDANAKLNRAELTPTEAQKMKQRIYKELENEYSKFSLHPAKADAQMAVARSAKEALEDLIPEIKSLNEKEGSLIELRKAIERSASRITNRDMMGIGVPIKGGLGASVGGYEGAIGGLALGVLDTPSVKTRLAIVLNRMKKNGVKVKPSATVARLLFNVRGEELSQDTNR